MATAREAIDLLNSLEGDEAREAQRLFTNDQGPVVAAARGKIAAAAKKEGKSGVTDLELKLADTEAQLEAARADLEVAQKQAPELAAKVTELSTKLRDQEKAHKDALKQKDDALIETSREVHVKGLAARLKARNLVGDYADEQAAPTYGKQIRKQPDGNWSVMKPGEDTPYDAPTIDAALDLLADDVVAKVREKSPGLILTNVDSGGGRGSGGKGGALNGKPSVDDLVAQKRTSTRYQL